MGRVALLGLIELQRSDPKRSAHPIPFAYGSRPHFSIIIGERQPTYATVIPRAVPAKAHSQRVSLTRYRGPYRKTLIFSKVTMPSVIMRLSAGKNVFTLS